PGHSFAAPSLRRRDSYRPVERSLQQDPILKPGRLQPYHLPPPIPYSPPLSQRLLSRTRTILPLPHPPHLLQLHKRHRSQNILLSRQHDDTTVVTSGLGTRSTFFESPDQDIPFTGGFIQIVDTLLVPPSRLEITARDAYKDLTSFLGALYKSGLSPALSSQKDITILAPRNAAFQSIASALDPLSREDLATVLKYHIIPDKVLSSSDLSALGNSTGSSLATLLGADSRASKVTVSRAGNNIFFNSAQLLQSDILLANGVIHIIDNVLNPDEFAEVPDLEAKSQTPVFQVSKGAETRTGTRVPAPFTTWLPCTTDCPEPTVDANTQRTATTTGRNGVNSQTSSGMGAQVTAVAGILGAVGVGVIGMGVM
ncbi:uncharacterized protein PODANS_6_10890, partial [Podospora anserina S mat+]